MPTYKHNKGLCWLVYSEFPHDEGESNNVLLDAINIYSVARDEFTKGFAEDGTNEDP